VQPDEVRGPRDVPAELGDRQRRGVRAEQRVVAQVRLDLAEDLLLDRRVLEDGLDDEVGARRGGRIVGGGDPQAWPALPRERERPSFADGPIGRRVRRRSGPRSRRGGRLITFLTARLSTCPA
jgi:hypothetical protein